MASTTPYSRYFLAFALLLLTSSFVQAFSTASSYVLRRSTSARSSSQLSMGLALPLSRPSILKKRAWYEETSGIKQRTVYTDDFDFYDEHGNFRGSAPFQGIQSAPIFFKSSSAAVVTSERKRDKAKRAAKWAFRKLRRRGD